MAHVLGQVARQSNSVRTPFKNVGFRVMLLAFFLPEGRHPPPMMRYGDCAARLKNSDDDDDDDDDYCYYF